MHEKQQWREGPTWSVLMASRTLKLPCSLHFEGTQAEGAR